ncbi:MAG: zinc ribbon domain-containing protein [Oscillospiraceae bacterium]|nr:zinc ribbon domain-containing protein [Oscillospiraceae bacterium]
MFCSKCGRQINNDALFCTFCGSPTTLAAPAAPAPADSVPAGVPTPGSIPMTSESYAASVPLPMAGGGALSVPAQNAEGYETDNAPIDEYESEAVPAASVPTEELSYGNGENIGDISEPTEYEESTARPLGLEQPAASVSLRSDLAARESAVPELVTAGAAGTVIDFSAPIQSAPPAAQDEKPAKYYTFGHIALCLAAVGVMAIVAGVFAGLYFSVI